MTFEQACKLVGTVQALWPHQPLATETPRVWHPLLAAFEYDDAEAAVRELAAAGREFPPPVGVLVAAVTARAADLPEWDEALAEIRRALATYRPPTPPGGFQSEMEMWGPPPADYWSSPVLAAFMAPRGVWQEWRMCPERDLRTFLAQQRDAYRALAARAQRDGALVALGAPRRSSLRRLDGAGLLGLAAPRRQLAEGGVA